MSADARSKTFVLDFGAKPLGSLEIANDLPIWKGPKKWQSHHGVSVSHWLLGRLEAVENVLLPDGVRTSAIKRGMPGTDLWRIEEEDGVWTYGQLILTGTDIAFILEENQPETITWPTGSLPHQLCSSSNACEMVGDVGFADDLYAALCSGLWKMVGTGKEYVGTWRRAAEVIATMRGLNEPYSDFLNTGTENFISHDASDLLGGMGWTFEGAMETIEERHMKALKVVEICEQREPDGMPDWYLAWHSAYNEKEHDPANRMNRAAFLGKATLLEFEKFWSHVDIEAEY